MVRLKVNDDLKSKPNICNYEKQILPLNKKTYFSLNKYIHTNL